MIESRTHDMGGLSPRPGIWVYCAEAQCPGHRKPLKLTISVGKIDGFLADIRKQIEALQREMANLRLVRAQLAGYQHKNRGKE
jgi:hypothetical protein